MSERKNIPELRFPEFCLESDAFPYKKFSFKDIFLFSSGKNIKQGEASPDFEIPCVRYGELYHMYSEVINEVINRTNLDKSELLFSKGDEILLPSAGEDPLDIGSASALTLDGVAIGRTINILKPIKPDIYSNRYVAYYINHKLRKKISKLAKGVSISNVYNSDLKKLDIILPAISEQQKVASFFTVIDKKISQLKQKKTLLEQYKKGVMQKIFTQEIRFKDENGQEFPNWKKKRLGEIGDFQTSSVDKLYVEGEKEVRLVNYMNVYRHETINKEAIDRLQLVTAKKNQIESNNLIRGDVLFTPSSETPKDIGHSVVIFEDLDECVYSYHLMRFRPKIEINILFSHYFCNIPDVLKQLSRLATGSTRFTISVKAFSSIETEIPCLDEQVKIANFLSAIDTKINRTKTQIENTELWKKGLLQKMFV